MLSSRCLVMLKFLASTSFMVTSLIGTLSGGWFAREADLLASVGKVILDPASRVPTTFSRMLLATDALECAEPSVAAAIHQVCHLGVHLAQAHMYSMRYLDMKLMPHVLQGDLVSPEGLAWLSQQLAMAAWQRQGNPAVSRLALLSSCCGLC